MCKGCAKNLPKSLAIINSTPCCQPAHQSPFLYSRSFYFSESALKTNTRSLPSQRSRLSPVPGAIWLTGPLAMPHSWFLVGVGWRKTPLRHYSSCFLQLRNKLSCLNWSVCLVHGFTVCAGFFQQAHSARDNNITYSRGRDQRICLKN